MATKTHTLISEQVLSGSAASVTFSSIPQQYKDLVLEIVASLTDTTRDTFIRYNGDTAADYSRTVVYGDGTNAGSTRTSGSGNDAKGVLGYCDFWMQSIMSYSSASVYKTTIDRYRGGNYVSAGVGLWRSTGAITSVTVVPYAATTFTAGSTFRLYGIL